MASSSHHSDTFDPRAAYPAATDSVLRGLRASFDQHIDWLDGYLQQVKDADVLRVKSANLPSRSPAQSSANNAGGLWVNILKSPARKGTKEASQNNTASNTTHAPISSLSYSDSSQLLKQKSIFSNSDSSAPHTKGSSSSSNSLSRSPGKNGLKGIASIQTSYFEGDKENAPNSSAGLSHSQSSHRDSTNNNTLNRSNGTPKRNILAATTGTAARSPGLRSPLQTSTSKARQQQQQQTVKNGNSSLSASAPASPLRSPAVQSKHQQSPLTRSQRLTHTTSSANASPSTSNIQSSSAIKNQRPVSPSPTPRPASRVIRPPAATQPQTSPRSYQQGGLLSPLAAGYSKTATPRGAGGTHVAITSTRNTTPIRVVDDVFTLPSTATAELENKDEMEADGEDSKESEDMDDDEEEIENILLGYTKTPATEPSKKVYKSEIVKTAPSGNVHPVVEIPIREKELPAIPQQQQQKVIQPSSPSAKSGFKAALTRISPPRPTKSPARPVTTAISTNNSSNKDNHGRGIIASISPSKMTRPMQNLRNHNYSPVKRDMSHLASIASMLSPSKPSREEEEASKRQEQVPSRPASPQLRTQSRVPVPQSTPTASPARPRSPLPAAAVSKFGTGVNSNVASPDSRPTSPSRISSRIAALAGVARGNTTSASRENSPVISSQATSPSRFGITRSPRLKTASRMDSPVTTSVPSQSSDKAAVSGLPTPTKMKRPMLSPIQSPNSQRSLALSSLRKAVPGFETNSFSPPASPRLPSTTSISSNIHQVQLPSVASTSINEVEANKATQVERELEELEKQVQRQLEKDEDLIHQHARAISALGKSFSPPPSPSRIATAVHSGKKEKAAGLSPPAKSPLRKMNSKVALANNASPSSIARTALQGDRAEMAPTPSKDANDTIMPQTVVKKVEHDTTIHSTAHKDSTVDIPPPSPIFSSFLSNNNNKRTSTLSFAGLPGRALGTIGTGREKSIGLGLGLGKSLGASSMKDRTANATAAQPDDLDSHGAQNHNRQSFYTAALASQSRKRLSSTLGSTNALNGLNSNNYDNVDAGGPKASRTEFANTARSSILASQMQQQSQPMSHSARFDLLRSRISNIKGTTGYVPPSSSVRASFAASTHVPPITQHSASSVHPAKADNNTQSGKTESTVFDKTSALFSPPPQNTAQEHMTTSQTARDIPTSPTSATSTLASTLASFVPAPSFGASFASIFGAGAVRGPKPDSPAKFGNTNEPASKNQAVQKQVQSMLYPSLPSMNNLNIPLPSFTSPERTVKKVQAEPEDQELVEELASEVDTEVVARTIRSASLSSSPIQQKKRSSSVLSIVSDIEAREADAKRERERQLSLSPRKASGAVQLPAQPTVQMHLVRAAAPRSTTPTFSPPKQDTIARLSTGRDDRRVSSRPESRLSDMPDGPDSDASSPDMSIAGVVDIEDPGLDAIPRTFSDEAEIPTTDAASENGDEEMDEADDESDTMNRHKKSDDRNMKPTAVLQQSAPAPKIFKPAASTAGNLSKSTFKPTRPGKDIHEVQRPVHRPPSRAGSVSSLAPSRASTVSLASTTSYNPSRPGTAMSMTSKKGNLSVTSSANARPEIKSLANAAAAAKKEQAEKERKAAIKEERDQKRAAFLAAKRDEQDSHSQQSSQGTANGAEKKRKEREDLNANQTASSQSSTLTKVKTVVKPTKTITGQAKPDDDHSKKRKMDGVEVVVHKPAVPKTTVARPVQQKATSIAQSAGYAKQTIASSSTSSNAKALAASASAIGVTKQAHYAGPGRPPQQQAPSSKAPLQPTKSANPQTLLSQHQQAILSASAAFGKSHASSSKATTPQVPAEPEAPEVEPFHLPEIDSEYSDSDEEVQAKKAALRPDWTHSPELRQALAVQAMFDPDQLFGEMPALRMEEIFKNPATMARLRHRTSSAHWSGPDAISRYEEKEYAKRMGFKRAEETDETRQAGPSGSSTRQ